MTRFKFFSLPLLITLVMAAATYLIPTKTIWKGKSNIMLMLPQGDDYHELWKKVDSLEDKGLPQSATEVVKQIFSLAKQDKNGVQQIKATIHLIKYNRYLKEDDYVIALNDLQNLTTEFEGPEKQLVHSIIAEVYWGYYTSNRYRFFERTSTVAFKNEDIRTWDLKKIFSQITIHYLLSLESSEQNKKVAINSFKDILHNYGPSKNLRPSLFDFLAHRALEFFMNTEPDIDKVKDPFLLEDPKHFSQSHIFCNTPVTFKDTLEIKYYALRLFQELENFHLNDEDPEALVDVTLKRMEFVRSHSVLPEKDTLYFVGLNSLRDKYSTHKTSAQVDHAIAKVHVEKGNLYDPLDPEQNNKWDKKAAVQICDKAIADFPGSYGSQLCLELKTELEKPGLVLSNENQVIPDEASLLLINSSNLKKAYFRIVQTGWDFSDIPYESTEKYHSVLLSYPAVHEWEQDLKDDGDLNKHNLEIKLPALKKGGYLILASTDKKFSYKKNLLAYSFIGVTQLSYSNKRDQENDEIEVSVRNRKTGQAMAGVKGTLLVRTYNYKKRKYEVKREETYTTDGNGSFRITPKGRDYRYFYLDLQTADDRFRSDQNFYQYRYHRHKENIQHYSQLFTDRAIYRPGQTIYFKGIIYSNNQNNHLEVVPNKRLSVTFYDANYEVISTQDVVTNSYGSYNGSFTAPQGLLNGQMHISDGYGTKYFSVEEYKRPRFEVNIDPVKGIYKLGDSLKLTGNAKSYSGAVIDGASVKFHVRRSSYFPFWWRLPWHYRSFGYSGNETEIMSGEVVTKDDGTFEITFPLLADKKLKKEHLPVFTFSITAEVTDITGETQIASGSVSAGYHAVNLNIPLPEQLFTDHKHKLKVGASNLNHEPVDIKGSLKIYQLKTPHDAYVQRYWTFPDRMSEKPDVYKKDLPFFSTTQEPAMHEWERVKKVHESTFNTADKDSILLPLEKWVEGYYLAEAISIDPFGNEVKDIHVFSLQKKENGDYGLTESFRVYDLKTQAEPGETAQLMIASSWKGLKVLAEIEHKGKIISREWINLDDSKQVLNFPVKEEHRGNLQVYFSVTANNRVFTSSHTIYVPFSNKNIEAKFITFRDKLLPNDQEDWKIKLTGEKGEKLAAEMMVSMYDASLDAFTPHSYYFNPYRYFYGQRYWESSHSFSYHNGNVMQLDFYKHFYAPRREYDQLNWFGYSTSRYYYLGMYKDSYYEEDGEMYFAAPAPAEEAAMDEISVSEKKESSKSLERESRTRADKNGDALGNVVTTVATGSSGLEQNMNLPMAGEKADNRNEANLDKVNARSNLGETAFFYPTLETDQDGNIIFSFKAPEALTRWKVWGVAHTRDMKIGSLEKEVITQKKLMVTPNPPRFFRENDQLTFTAKVSNLSDKDLNGKARLVLTNPFTGKNLDDQFSLKKNTVDFAAKKGQSAAVQWEIKIPEGVQAVTWKVIATADEHSDGEEAPLPILTNSMLVTESLPLPVRKKGTHEFELKKLVNSGKPSTLRHHKLTLEFTSNPAWYAIQSLPYLMEYPYECSEQTFSRYYANAIAHSVATSSPRVKQVFDSWRNYSPESFLSNLQKNEELKSLLLQETPWVFEAKNESERKKRVALLFDLNRMSNELGSALRKLQKAQSSNGGWPWFPGMPESRYITQHIVTGFGHLDKLHVKSVREDNKTWNMLREAVAYLDVRIAEDLNDIKKYYPNYKKEQHLSSIQVHYLYGRSFFTDLPIPGRSKEAVEYFSEQAIKYWKNFGLYEQGMLSLASHRTTNKQLAADIAKSLKERAIIHEELGAYWKDNHYGYYWYEAPIETQSLMIEVFNEVAADETMVNDLKAWLLKNKQTNDWKTTKATADACYALLLTGDNWLAETEPVKVYLNNEWIDPSALGAKVEAGTGYFKTTWSGNDIKAGMGKVKVEKPSNSVSWGALYWQYFEQLDKITPHETPLKLNKKLFQVKRGERGEEMSPVTEKTSLNNGDRIRVRIELRTDRDMEYVHMKDMRASCFEPVNVFSQYKYRDGLGYYESTKDASTNFFFDRLPKGTYVFEYDLLVAQKGNFSNGITTIQCMYAPEFTSHSEGIRVQTGR